MRLAGRQREIHAERDRKLEAARKQRQIRRQQAAEPGGWGEYQPVRGDGGEGVGASAPPLSWAPAAAQKLMAR